MVAVVVCEVVCDDVVCDDVVCDEVGVEVPDVVGVEVPDVLVLVLDVSGCSDSEVLVPEVSGCSDSGVRDFVPEVLVLDDSDVLLFETSEVRDFPLTP